MVDGIVLASEAAVTSAENQIIENLSRTTLVYQALSTQSGFASPSMVIDHGSGEMENYNIDLRQCKGHRNPDKEMSKQNTAEMRPQRRY